MSKKKLLLLCQIAFYLLVLWFIAQRFGELTSAFELGKLLNKPFHLVCSAVCFLVFYGLLALHWQRACSLYAKYPQHRQWLSYFASQPYKYLPSSIFAFSSRAVYARKAGLPIKQSSLIQLIENFNILLGSLSVSLLFLAFRESFVLGVVSSTLLLAGLVIITFIPALKLPKSAISISGRKWASLFIFILGGWCFAGMAFYMLVSASGQNISLVTAISANATAMGLGILAIFAPGGIGVREFIYNKFSIALPGIVLWRLFTLVIDICAGFASIYLINKQSKPNM